MPSNAIQDYLLALEQTGLQDLPDGALLERFVAQREQAALRALFQKHGPLVWGVCRRVLREEHSAEDAFQATFLVLLRKAGSVRKADSVRSWLYGVANRVARRARAQEAARQKREKVPPRPAELPSTAPEWEELRAILDEEVQRLPEKYRLPVVLCYLEGLSTVEAGRELGCPAATIATRLARAREQLRACLSRRGVSSSASAFTLFLSQQSVAPVPGGLLAATAQAGSAFLTGASVLSAPIATLTTETLRAMFLNKLKPALAVLISLVVLGGGLGLLASRGPAAAPLPEKAPAARPPAKPVVNAKLARLLKERLKAAQDEYEARNQEFLAGRGTQDILHGASVRLLKAQRELARNKAERITAYREQVKRATEIAKLLKEGYELGRIKAADHFQGEFFRLEAEIELEREVSK